MSYVLRLKNTLFLVFFCILDKTTYFCINKTKVMKKELLDLELQMAEWIDFYFSFYPNETGSRLWEIICEELGIDLDDAVISEMYNNLLPKK